MNEKTYLKKHLNIFAQTVILILFALSYVFAVILAVIFNDFLYNFNNNLIYNNAEVISVVFYVLLNILIVFCEIKLCKKTDMSLRLILFAPFISNIMIIAGSLLFYKQIGFYYQYYSVETNIVIGIVSVVRCVIYAVGMLKKMKFKTFALCLLSTVLCVSCFAVNEWSQNVLETTVNRNQSDLTSSWNSINQIVERDSHWREIVTQTEFKVSDPVKTLDSYGEVGYYCNLDTYPNIDGSTVCVPMAVEFARQHLDFDDQMSKDIVSFSTTHYAYTNLIDKADTGMVGISYKDSYLDVDLGSVDIVIATHPSDEELETAKEKGVELILEPLCYDAFVFITHKDNPVESLTVEQIKDIYSGKITNWKDVGGRNEKIRAFQREANSGSQTAMERLVMGGSGMIDPIKVLVIAGMGELVEAVAEYENETASLGYTYRYYIDNLYKNDEIKIISIDGIAPTDENIRSEAYPYTTNYYGVIRKEDENETGGKFLRWMLSDEGQACISQAGYIAIKQ